MSIQASHRVTGVATDPANREKDDYYPSPPIAVEKLLSVESFHGCIWEPCCGEGHISEVLKAKGHEVISSDLVNRGYGEHGIDFLMEWKSRAPNIITNPPFKNSEEFAKKSIHLATDKVAFLCRLAWLEGIERGKMFQSTPLARVWVFSKRLTMNRGVMDESKNGGMIAFAWFIWQHGYTGKPTLGWI